MSITKFCLILLSILGVIVLYILGNAFIGTVNTSKSKPEFNAPNVETLSDISYVYAGECYKYIKIDGVTFLQVHLGSTDTLIPIGDIKEIQMVKSK